MPEAARRQPRHLHVQRGHGVLQRRVPERADGGGRGGGEEEGERQGGGDTWGPARRQGSGRPAAGAARQGPGRVHPGPVNNEEVRSFPKISTHGMPFSFAFFPSSRCRWRVLLLPYETHHHQRSSSLSCSRGFVFFC